MRRYYFNQPIVEGEILIIEGEIFKHIFKVCRLSIGNKFELLSDHKAYLAEVEEVGKSSAAVVIRDSRQIAKLKKPYINLVLANPKPAVFEAVVEKAVELGVRSIFPITTDNSFFKNIQKLKLKEARIQKIIKQAMQQTGRFEALDLKESTDLKDFLTFFAKGAGEGFVLYEGSAKPAVLFKDLEGREKAENIFLLVGGEGGFTAQEVAMAGAVGIRELSLGEQILRVETACVAGISILKSNLDTW